VAAAFRRGAAALLPTGKGRFARDAFCDMTEPMLMMPHPAARTRLGDWPLAVKSILGFWLFYALTVVARAFLGSDPWTVIYNRSFTVG
jgi:hypothetical protein